MVDGVWHPKRPPATGKLAALRKAAPVKLPRSYLSQLESSNGGEGSLSLEPGWVLFWKVEEVLRRNKEYAIAEFLPGFFGFGSNGAGELLAFDLRRSRSAPVVMVPFIGMDPAEAVVVASSFDVFRKAIGA
jgi:hypothetical protein